MNTSKQFWTLVRFQVAVSPAVWVLPLALCTPLFFIWHGDPSLDLIILTQNLFLIVLLGALLLAPEIFTSASMSQAAGLGAEFIRTRAVDKSVLVRAKAAFFYYVAQVAPVGVLLYSLGSPDLRVTIYSKTVRLDCLQHIAGSALVADSGGRSNLVSIPLGNVLIATWRAWEFLALAVAVQVFVYLIYPYRCRRILFWALIILTSVGPVFGTLFQHNTVPWDERLFFSYAAHQALFWILAAGALVIGQIWCERRFAQLEH